MVNNSTETTKPYHLKYFFVFAKTQSSEYKHDGYVLFNIWHLAHDSAVHTDASFPLGFHDINVAKLQVQHRNRFVAFLGKRDYFCHMSRSRGAAFEHKHLHEAKQ